MTTRSPLVTSPAPANPAGASMHDGDWIFPLREASIATRAALVTAATALSLVVLGVLATIAVLLMVLQPGSVVGWIPFALVPLAVGVVVAWRWQPIPAFGYLGIAVMAAASMVALTIAAHESPAQASAGTAGFLLSMTTSVVVLMGAVSDRWTGGIAGALGGWTLAEGAVAATGAAIGLPYRLDVPPIAITVGLALGYAVAPIARSRARRGTAALEEASRRTAARRLRELEGRESIAQLHDTLLGTLAALSMREPGPISDTERAQLTASLESSAILPLLREEAPEAFGGLGGWLESVGAAGGIRVVLEGDVAALDEVDDAIGSALRAALEQCIVNVARHAGVRETWIAVVASAAELSVTVIDEGIGFDPDSVPRDRLGLSESICGRVERSGGRVRVWSKPGTGTSVNIVVPGAGS